MMDKRIVLILAATLSCCGDNGGEPARDAAIPRDDAAPPDAEINTCTVVAAHFADLGTITGTAALRPAEESSPEGPQYLSLAMPLNADAMPDTLFLELWDQTGVFEEGFAPKTIALISNQADLILCSACAYIAPDYVPGALIDFHMAYDGELVIEEIDPTPGTGRVKGTLANLKLHAVTIDQAGQETIDMGCKISLDAIAFDFDIAVPPPE